MWSTFDVRNRRCHNSSGASCACTAILLNEKYVDACSKSARQMSDCQKNLKSNLNLTLKRDQIGPFNN